MKIRSYWLLTGLANFHPTGVDALLVPTISPTPTDGLDQCQSGCSQSSDCSGSLVCYGFENDDSLEVPGCGFLPDDFIAFSYCIDIDNVPDGVRFSLTPDDNSLKRCQGGCASLLVPRSCEGGLECWDKFDADVPGCTGATISFGFCYDPADLAVPSPVPTAAPTSQVDLPLENVANLGKPEGAYPLSRCQADCDDASECQEGLICFERGPKNPVDHVPGCIGTPAYKYTDFCISPRDLDPFTLVYLGQSGKPQSVYPLQNCQGHCRNSGDCDGSLQCFQRYYGQTDAIPGCVGVVAEDNTNYCYDPGYDAWLFQLDWAAILKVLARFLGLSV